MWIVDTLESLQSMINESLGEYQVLAASLPDIWTILIIPAFFGLMYCFFGCKRWVRRLLGGVVGLALFSLLTFALAPRLFDPSPTVLLLCTVAMGLLGALILSFGNVILEFLAYFLAFRFALILLTGWNTTVCVVIALVLAWGICIVFVRKRMIPTAVAGAALCGLASMYFGNIFVSVAVFVVMLVLGILTQRALMKAAEKKKGGKAAVADGGSTQTAEAVKDPDTTQVLEARPDLTGLPAIPQEAVATQALAAVEEPATVQPMVAADNLEVSVDDQMPTATEVVVDQEPADTKVLEEACMPVLQLADEPADAVLDLEEDGFIELEKNVTSDDLWDLERPASPKAVAPFPSASVNPSKRRKDKEFRGPLVAATALATTVLTLISLGLLKTFKRD